MYRPSDRAINNCFGGQTPPRGVRKKEPGIYYRDKEGRWTVWPWRPGEQDAGVVITARDPSSLAMKMAIFGFSGPATIGTGTQLLKCPEKFWGDSVEARGKQVSVHICRFRFRPSDDIAEPVLPSVEEVEVVPQSKDVLKEHLQ